MTVFDRSKQGQRYRETMLKRMDELFRGKTFDIVREVHLGYDQYFLTVFNRPCRRGYVIRDRASGQEYAVGGKTLKAIHDLYLGVTLPSYLLPKRKPRPTGTSTPST